MNKIELTNEQLGKIVGGIVLGGAFIYAYLFFFWIPISKAITANNEKNIAMERDIAAAKAQKAAYADLEARLAQLKDQKEDVKQKLPGEKQFPDLIKMLMQLASKYKVAIQSITPGQNQKGEYFTKTSYQVSAFGNYHDIGRFLSAIGLEVRIMTVENLMLTGTPASATGTASASFTLITYQYNENTAPSAAKKKGK